MSPTVDVSEKFHIKTILKKLNLLLNNFKNQSMTFSKRKVLYNKRCIRDIYFNSKATIWKILGLQTCPNFWNKTRNSNPTRKRS